MSVVYKLPNHASSSSSATVYLHSLVYWTLNASVFFHFTSFFYYNTFLLLLLLFNSFILFLFVFPLFVLLSSDIGIADNQYTSISREYVWVWWLKRNTRSNLIGLFAWCELEVRDTLCWMSIIWCVPDGVCLIVEWRTKKWWENWGITGGMCVN